jgi:hypothetical protein
MAVVTAANQSLPKAQVHRPTKRFTGLISLYIYQTTGTAGMVLDQTAAQETHMLGKRRGERGHRLDVQPFTANSVFCGAI